jgi:hypothetical protein
VHAAKQLAKLGVPCAIIATNRSWTTFALLGELDSVHVAVVLGAVVMPISSLNGSACSNRVGRRTGEVVTAGVYSDVEPYTTPNGPRFRQRISDPSIEQWGPSSGSSIARCFADLAAPI